MPPSGTAMLSFSTWSTSLHKGAGLEQLPGPGFQPQLLPLLPPPPEGAEEKRNLGGGPAGGGEG